MFEPIQISNDFYQNERRILINRIRMSFINAYYDDRLTPKIFINNSESAAAKPEPQCIITFTTGPNQSNNKYQESTQFATVAYLSFNKKTVKTFLPRPVYIDRKNIYQHV